jgi:hypothetical protein
MSFLRFNHVFSGLMLLALCSAFVVPERVSSAGRAQVQGLFAPVARPVRLIASWLHDRLIRPDSLDSASPDQPRNLQQLRDENDTLKQLTASLSLQLQGLQELNADRSKLGAVRAFCTPFDVFGQDSGTRDSLNLKGSSFAGLRAGMPVICPQGLVGSINAAGAAGASVRLATDRGYRLEAIFGRVVPKANSAEFVALRIRPFVVEGQGNGLMLARLINFAEQRDAGLRPGDWVVIKDTRWPPLLQGTRIGRVTSIEPQRSGPGYAEVRIEPFIPLYMLKSVMVMNRE